MKTRPTNPNARWINTRVEYQWDGQQYVEVLTEGYWYDGDMALAHDQPSTGLQAYRFYDSANSTAIAAQDVDPTTLTADTTYVFRVLIQQANNADENATTFDLEYENSTQATGWLPVTAASNHIRTADASGLTDGTAVTAATLTGGTGSFVNGEEVEDGISGSITVTALNHTELWYAFTVRSADVANNDNINLRVTMGGTVLDFETVSPSITASVPVPDDLLADDVSTTSSVSVPTATGVNGALADDVATTSSLTTPTATGVNGALADDVATTSSVSTPTATHVLPPDDLLADDVATASTVSVPTATGVNGALADDVTSASSVSVPTLVEQSVGDALLADDVATTSAVSTPTATGVNGMLADDVSVTTNLTTPTATGVNGMLADDVATASTVSIPTVATVDALLATSITVTTSVSTVTMSEQYLLDILAADEAKTYACVKGKWHSYQHRGA